MSGVQAKGILMLSGAICTYIWTFLCKYYYFLVFSFEHFLWGQFFFWDRWSHGPVDFVGLFLPNMFIPNFRKRMLLYQVMKVVHSSCTNRILVSVMKGCQWYKVSFGDHWSINTRLVERWNNFGRPPGPCWVRCQKIRFPWASNSYSERLVTLVCINLI